MNQRLFTIVEVVVIGALVVFVMYIGGAFKGPEPTPTNEPTRPPATATRPRPTATLRATAAPAIAGTLPAITSPAGLIAFESTRDGNSEIYVVDANNAFPINLTNNPAEDYAPIWSPDGSRLAFFSTRTGWLEIFVMNADGSGVIQLTNTQGTNTVYRHPISWSPDGEKILAVRAEAWYVGRPGRPSSLDLIQADGSSITTLYQQDEAEVGRPSWSPDGNYIAALVYGPSIVSGVHVGKTGESPFNLSSPNYLSNCWSYGWSPDGKLTCFSGSEIFAVNADGSDRKSLVGFRSGYLSDAAWSPDGKLLLYMGNVFTSASATPGLKIHVANADGSGQRELPLDSEPAEIGVPSWSPDSQWIAYSAKANDQFNIYIVNVYDTYQHAQLTINVGDNFSPQWQP